MLDEKNPPGHKTRGAVENPPNRFDRLHLEPDPEYAQADPDDPDQPSPKTELYRDTSRTAIAYNQSPDVGFEASLNPYRGCEHGCVYCLWEETPILLADGTSRRIGDLEPGDEIFGTVKRGAYRRFVKTAVLAHWRSEKPAVRLVLADGTVLLASADHRFLTERGWKYVLPSSDRQRPHLTTNNTLMGFGGIHPHPTEDEDYITGYICGMVRGDGLLASYSYTRVGRAHGNQHQFRLALIDDEALQRTANFLLRIGVQTHRYEFQKARPQRQAMRAIRTHALRNVEIIRQAIEWPEPPGISWCKGFLAGIYDAEGGCATGSIRIHNTDSKIIAAIQDSLASLGFEYQLESVNRLSKPLYAVRLRGGLDARLRLLHMVNPAIRRKISALVENTAVKSAVDLRVVSIRPLGKTLPM